MVRFLRFPKTLCAVLAGAAFALAIPGAASADHRYRRHDFGVWLPFPPPPPFFFAPRVHRHGPYCGHGGYGGYDRYDRYERRYDRHDERGERRRDRHERHER